MNLINSVGLSLGNFTSSGWSPILQVLIAPVPDAGGDLAQKQRLIIYEELASLL